MRDPRHLPDWLYAAALDFENKSYRPFAHYIMLFKDASTYMRLLMKAQDPVARGALITQLGLERRLVLDRAKSSKSANAGAIWRQRGQLLYEAMLALAVRTDLREPKAVLHEFCPMAVQHGIMLLTQKIDNDEEHLRFYTCTECKITITIKFSNGIVYDMPETRTRR